MFKNLPRQSFGRLQSKLFPRYFGVGALCVVVQLLTVKALNLDPAALKTVYTTLGVGLASGLLNLWFLEPKVGGCGGTKRAGAAHESSDGFGRGLGSADTGHGGDDEAVRDGEQQRAVRSAVQEARCRVWEVARALQPRELGGAVRRDLAQLDAWRIYHGVGLPEPDFAHHVIVSAAPITSLHGPS
eukprot:scaffold1875_cov253-Pinguiococcus_pyrenoidosus.AAC.12